MQSEERIYNEVSSTVATAKTILEGMKEYKGSSELIRVVGNIHRNDRKPRVDVIYEEVSNLESEERHRTFYSIPQEDKL